ncbi:MAG: hypothetical protein JRI45_05920 [Deltaproteobacteria bacterium]|nr:hypothetical protein [Deltaproteobacteria bacterium]MBW2069060.1 hypothetical protein [Deltaproteobacteria bacterium]
MAYYAAIDLGSHTVRMLIVSVKGGIVSPVKNERVVTGLAKEFAQEKRLSKTGKLATIETLKYYRRIMHEQNVESYICGATGVLRKAADARDFLDEIFDKTGIVCTVLTEEDEALISFKGTTSMLYNSTDPVIVFDLGGSSTEFVLAEKERPVFLKSLFIGASTLTSMFLQKAPAPPSSVQQARTYIDTLLPNSLKELLQFIRGRPIGTLIGTAGTVATLGAIKKQMENYVPYKICGLEIDRQWLSEIINEIASKDIEERRKIKGLEPGREDIILGGAIIVEGIMKTLGMENIVVSDAGLLEGLAIKVAERETETNLTWKS